MESARVMVLNIEGSPVKCRFPLRWHIRGRSRVAQFITACGRTSAAALRSRVINGWRGLNDISGRCLDFFFFIIDSCTLFNFDLVWEQMTAHSRCLALSALSHPNEQSPLIFFSSPPPAPPPPHDYLTPFLLSPNSASWSNRAASQAKTWASCAPASVPVPLPPSLTQMLTRSEVSAHPCILIWWFTVDR